MNVVLQQIRRAATLILVLSCTHAYAATATSGSLTAEQARQDAAILVSAMRALHPALDKYRSQAQVAADFAHFSARAGAARSASEMYLAATELAASVRCGHTWTNVLNQQGAIKQHLLGEADKLPFTMTLVAGRWRVLASADAGVKPGDEIVSIDGQPAAAIIARMLPYLRADGSSDGKRLRQLSHDRLDYSMMDIVWPLLSPPGADGYRIAVMRPDGSGAVLRTLALSLAQRKAALHGQGGQGGQPLPQPSDAWQLQLAGAHAVLTLPSFALYRSDFDWRTFLHKAFAELKQKKVPNLIIDIRANEGGDGAIGLALLSYLVRTPLTYIADQSVSSNERVPYRLARYLDTWDFGFFDRTGMVTPITQGTAAGRYSFTPKAGKSQSITPDPQGFQGRVYLLVGPENSSATFALADLAKRSGAAVLVGQATGGNQRGLNGGQLAWVTLPHSGVAVDIPLLASTYLADTPDTSVTPDIVVTRSFAAQAAGRDQEMEAALLAMAAAR